MPPHPDRQVVTYKCEGCGTRSPAPAPYGGFKHTACSEACLARAIRRGAHQRTARRVAFISRLLEESHATTP